MGKRGGLGSRGEGREATSQDIMHEKITHPKMMRGCTAPRQTAIPAAESFSELYRFGVWLTLVCDLLILLKI